MLENSHRFFKNISCSYYPCHKNIENLNCLFCYCPLYPFADCGGNFHKTENGIKVCTDCIRPHIPENYDEIIGVLKKKYTVYGKKEDKI